MTTPLHRCRRHITRLLIILTIVSGLSAIMGVNGAFSAPATVSADPPVCLATPQTKNAIPTGPLTPTVPLNFPYRIEGPLDELYARLSISVEICPNASFGSSSQSGFDRFLNMVGITSDKSFASTLTVSNKLLGLTLPTIYPISYTASESARQWASSISQEVILPWQSVRAEIDIRHSYSASRNVSVATAQMISDVISSIITINSSTTLLSSPARASIDVANNVIQKIASRSFSSTDLHVIDSAIDYPQGRRGLIIRLNDGNGRQFAGIKINTILTNTLADGSQFDFDMDHVVPQFSSLPLVLDIVFAPGSPPQRLRNMLETNNAFRVIMSESANTSPDQFAKACDGVAEALNDFGLNKFDTALALADILGKSNFVKIKNLYESDCARNSRVLLRQMGLQTALSFGHGIGSSGVGYKDFCAIDKILNSPTSNGLATLEGMFSDPVILLRDGDSSYPATKSSIVDLLMKEKISHFTRCEPSYDNHGHGTYDQYIAEYPHGDGVKTWKIIVRGVPSRDGPDQYAPLTSKGIGWMQIGQQESAP